MERNKININTLYDRAYMVYERNRKEGRRLRYEEWLDIISPEEATAVILITFHTQICNGGFMQWHENGYSTDCNLLIDTMRRYCTIAKGHDLAKAIKIINILYRFQKFGSECYWGEPDEDIDWKDPEVNPDLNYEAFNSHLDGLDIEYYELSGLEDLYAQIVDRFFEWENKAVFENLQLIVKGNMVDKIKIDPEKIMKGNGNAFAIMSRVRRALKDAGLPELVEEYMSEATKGDYNNLVRVSMHMLDKGSKMVK